MNVLVVDNDEGILNFSQMLLEEHGYTVRTAEDGLAALEVLHDFSANVVFIDLVMPNIDGKKLCRLLRSDDAFDSVFLIVLSAISSEEEMEYTQYGFDACIAKGPFKRMGENILKALDDMKGRTRRDYRGTFYGKEHLYKREITRELLSNKNHFELILGNMAESILELTSDGVIVYCNEASVFLLGASEEQILAKPFVDFFTGIHKDRISELLRQALTRHVRTERNEPIELKNKLISLNILTVRDDDRKSIIVILNDITEQLTAERELKSAHDELEKRVQERTEELKKTNTKLQQSLEEKEILLREIHHRVKNNLQIISSLIGLHSRRIKDKSLNTIFTETRNRIQSIAMVHEELYQDNNLSQINFREYIEKLGQHLLATFGVDRSGLKFVLDIEESMITVNHAITCGLLLNELISNAIKHAFDDKKSSVIEVKFLKRHDNMFILKVSDNGPGMPENFDVDDSEQLGLRIVKTLVSQLSGKIHFVNNGGLVVNIEFPQK